MVEVLGALFRAIEVPGHTLDHVAFFSDSDLFETPVAFTGDTLFVAGCGRLFEVLRKYVRKSPEARSTTRQYRDLLCS